MDHVECDVEMTFPLRMVSDWEMYTTIQSLKNSNATGWDEWPTSIIKHTCIP